MDPAKCPILPFISFVCSDSAHHAVLHVDLTASKTSDEPVPTEPRSPLCLQEEIAVEWSSQSNLTMECWINAQATPDPNPVFPRGRSKIEFREVSLMRSKIIAVKKLRIFTPTFILYQSFLSLRSPHRFKLISLVGMPLQTLRTMECRINAQATPDPLSRFIFILRWFSA